jgi:hypothetical protein
LDLMVVGNPSSFALHVPASAVPESTIIAFEIYILSQIQPEIWDFRFTAAILDLRLNGMSDNVGDSTVEKTDPKTWG